MYYKYCFDEAETGRGLQPSSPAGEGASSGPRRRRPRKPRWRLIFSRLHTYIGAKEYSRDAVSVGEHIPSTAEVASPMVLTVSLTLPLSVSFLRTLSLLHILMDFRCIMRRYQWTYLSLKSSTNGQYSSSATIYIR